MTGGKGWKDLREGYMAGPGGVPSGHPVAVEVPVVVLQLLEAVKGHKAVLALLLNAQEVIPPALRQSLLEMKKKRKDCTSFGISLMRSQVSCRAAHGQNLV